MIYRPVDENGDMVSVVSKSQLLEGKSAVMAAVHSRLRLLHGEWWENRSIGFTVPAFLFDGTRMPAGEQMLVNYITAFIRKTPGVLSVTDVSAVVKDRKMNYSCTIVTDDGEVEGRVSGDVLLRAVY